MEQTTRHTMPRQKFWLLIMVLSLMAFVFTGCAVGNDTWYTRVEDSYGSEHDTNGSPFDFSGAGNMEYSYTIPCWNASGQSQELTFGADEKIESGTYIQLETQIIRGVVSWKTVDAQDIPEDVLKDIDQGIDSGDGLPS